MTRVETAVAHWVLAGRSRQGDRLSPCLAGLHGLAVVDVAEAMPPWLRTEWGLGELLWV